MESFDNLEVYIEGDLEKDLNEGYAHGKKHLDNFPPAVLINSLTGSGKSSRVKAWLKHFNVNHIYIEGTLRGVSNFNVEVDEYPPIQEGIRLVSGEEMAKLLTPNTIEKNVNVVFSSDEVDKMSEKDIVIVIDDYDWASLDVRKEFLNLIMNSKVTDIREKDNNFYKKLNDIAMIVVITHPNASPFSEPYTDEENKIFGKKQ